MVYDYESIKACLRLMMYKEAGKLSLEISEYFLFFYFQKLGVGLALDFWRKCYKFGFSHCQSDLHAIAKVKQY